jgi:hypothetical protein
MNARLVGPLALAALILPGAAGAGPAHVKPKPKPAWAQARLVGAWFHTVTQQDYENLGIGDKGFGVGRWRIVVDKLGFVNAYAPSAPQKDDFDTKLTVGPHNRLWIGLLPICGDVGPYHGRIVNGTLRITADTADVSCLVRRAMFAGTWTRKR